MSGAGLEQRNAYKGTPERAWVHVRLVATDGSTQDVELMADTGSPCAVIISSSRMSQVSQKGGPTVDSNFGLMSSGWLRLVIPGVGLDELVLGYASDVIATDVKNDCPDFEGLLGLPVLRMLEYGGDADSFWIRSLSSNP